MKRPFLTTVFAAALCAAAALASPALRAQAAFDIHLDTSALIANPAGPFYLDFQLNDGSGGGNNDNIAILSSFNFNGGGTLTGVNTFGGAAGNLSSTVTLNDSSFINEFFQPFTPGTSLDFHLVLSTNVDSPTPDLFVFSILDQNTYSLPTTAASDAFAEITIDGLTPSAIVYAGDVAGGGIAINAPAVTAVPELSAVALLLGAAVLGFAYSWRRFTRSSRVVTAAS